MMNDFELEDIYTEMSLVDSNNRHIKTIKLMDMNSISYAMSLPKLENIDTDFHILSKMYKLFTSKIKDLKVPHDKIYWCNDKNIHEFINITKMCIEEDYDVVIFSDIGVDDDDYDDDYDEYN